MDMSVLKSIATIAEKFAPTIASVLTGGASTEITTVIALLSNLFGANPQNPDELLQKINADADAQVKLKQIELDYQSKLAETDEKDRESARQMNNATEMRRFLVFFIIVFITVDSILCFFVKDAATHNMMSGAFLIALPILKKIYDLYFGNGSE